MRQMRTVGYWQERKFGWKVPVVQGVMVVEVAHGTMGVQAGQGARTELWDKCGHKYKLWYENGKVNYPLAMFWLRLGK